MVSSIPAGAFSLCECVVCCCCCGPSAAAAVGVGVVDDRRRSVVTYGLPHQATSAVDTPDVARAVAARATRAVDGRDDSTMKMNGESEPASAREDRENILRRRNVCVRGPT